jgi:hypothetical protein
MVATAGVGIVGLFVALYAAHSFLVVLEQTAAGRDEVDWPDDVIVDWFWKPFLFVWVIGFWVVPAWLLISLVALVLRPLAGYYATLIAVIWFIFPISLLSSLHAQSRLTVLDWTIVRRLAKNAGSMGLFYAVTGVLIVGSAVFVVFALKSPSWLPLPLAACAVSAVLLIDARLLGRIAWLVGHRTPEKARGGKKRAARVPDPWNLPQGTAPTSEAENLPATESTSSESAPPAPSSEPADLPLTLFPQAQAAHQPKARTKNEPRYFDEYDEVGLEPLEPAPGGPTTPDSEWDPPMPYDVKADEPSKATPHRTPTRAARVEGYDLQKDDAPVMKAPIPLDGYTPIGLVPLPPPAHENEAPTVSRFEERLLLREAPPRAPTWPMWQGVYQFPWYPKSFRAWLGLSLLIMTLGALIRVQILLWPFGS